MEPFDLSDAGVLIGLVGLSIGAYCLYLKHQIEKLDRIISEKEAALNAPGSRPRRAAKASALHRRTERR